MQVEMKCLDCDCKMEQNKLHPGSFTCPKCNTLVCAYDFGKRMGKK
jgi:hypothetical protein